MSCAAKKTLTLHSNDIEQILIYEGFSDTEVKMKSGFENDFITDLNNSKALPPTKFIKTHRILIYYNDHKVDTIYSNGKIQDFNGWFQSDENLIEKYAANEAEDKIQGQLNTAKKLKSLMDKHKYSEAVLLFSEKQREDIYKIMKDDETFHYWCLMWTLDEATYQKYINHIKSGEGRFVLEENEWKIDEK